MILAADVGGTKTLIAVFEVRKGKLEIIEEQKLASREYSSLEEAVCTFFNSISLERQEITGACFSLAGPVYGKTCRLTNLEQTVDLEQLRIALDFIPTVHFCNDLEAAGHGIFALEEKDLYCLNPETPGRKGPADPNKEGQLNKAVIAPGTGLGESLIIAGRYVCPTEGAHTEFGPQSEPEVKLWRFLHKEFGHVSYERILSGPGLVNIYRFLKTERFGYSTHPDSGETPEPEEITYRALSKTCPICVETLDIFVRILGAEAGNLALKSLALGGVYLGGGIPPKILPKLQDGTFLSSFCRKGRFSYLMKDIPVYVILNEKTALYGAARIAAGIKTSI